MGAQDEIAYEPFSLKRDPLRLLDPSDDTVVDVNHAAGGMFFDRPREQLCGMHAAELLEERLGAQMTMESRSLAQCRAASGDEADVKVEYRSVIMDDRKLTLVMVRSAGGRPVSGPCMANSGTGRCPTPPSRASSSIPTISA